ncbi:hypothetical protein [Billgrantia endophytica]|uniref:hypothetical protein n=1 Tax=Billgrantia endophytica TaxID=2033802 RepID=UPI001055FE4F|nr:hypothetical protein [Halomonas endophytica]
MKKQNEKDDPKEKNEGSGVVKIALAPFKWVYKAYPKKYMSIGRTYTSPGAISKNTADHYKSVKANKAYSREQIKKEFKSITTNLSRSRRRYIGNMKRLGMHYEDRVREYRWGQFVQFASMIFFACMFIHAQLHIFIANTNGEYLLIINNGINSTILSLTAIISSVGYFVGAWKGFSARNMMQLNPFQFLEILIRHPSEILPLQDFEENLESCYGYNFSGSK